MRDRKFASERMFFLIESQSYFSSNSTATHSRVKRTTQEGLLFYLISPISPRLRVFRASCAPWRTGRASLSILSASAFVSRIVCAFSLTYLSSSCTTALTLLAARESTSSFYIRLSVSAVFIFRMGYRSVSLALRSDIMLLASANLLKPEDNLDFQLVISSFLVISRSL